VWEDRRRIVGLSGDLDLMLASARERLASGARHASRTVVATAGERIAVARVLWAGGPPDGRFEIEFLALHEVNEAGLATAVIFFDADDARAAQREAWTRWARIDPAAAAVTKPLGEMIDAFDAHDSHGFRAALADDLVVEDHRRTGIGRVEGADAYVGSIEALWKLAPDTQVEAGWRWLAHARHGAVTVLKRTGRLPDAGEFESEYLYLLTVADGRVTRLEFFELDAADAALARFESLADLPPGN
jgi:ketosteroid isomerase-like protein